MCLIFLTGCANKETSDISAANDTHVEETTYEPSKEILEESTAETEVQQEIAGKSEQSDTEYQARKILSEMTLEEKVYQMFFITPEQLTGVGKVVAAGTATKEAIEKYPVGGIIYFSQNIVSREQTESMIKNIQSYSKIPVFTGVDEEGGIVSRIGSNLNMGTTVFPNMQEIGNTGDVKRAYEVGYVIGTESMELGFNLDFAPVADVFSNPNNTVIGARAFSIDAKIAADMVESCVKGFHDANMLCTLKHYPGHGDTLKDSHYGTAVTNKTLEELRHNEFLPFKKGIHAGADFVMVGHILTPNITDSSTPATLSGTMISILRDELEFDGVIITDAMNMAAISDEHSSAEAAVKAIQAGVDMILMPVDFHDAVTGVMNAVKNGVLMETMINDSVLRILCTKIDKGIIFSNR